MKQPPTDICPLLAIAGAGGYNVPAACLHDRCAWWDHAGSECALVTGAIAIRETAENLETLASKSQALANLQKKTAQGAANTPDGKVEKVLTGSDSTSTITENGGFVK